MFGQSDDGGADSDVGGSTRRPAPDMRRYAARHHVILVQKLNFMLDCECCYCEYPMKLK